MLRVRLFRDGERVFEGSARQVVLPGEDGELAVLDWHAPMLCALADGTVQIDERSMPVRGGIARVERNRVTVIAHSHSRWNSSG